MPTSVTHWTTDSPLVYALNITQDQGVPYNMTVKYANGTTFDLTANTWMTVDYSSLSTGNSTVTVTINTDSLGPYYNQTDLYELNFEVQTLDSTNNVTQDHLINVTLENGKSKYKYEMLNVFYLVLNQYLLTIHFYRSNHAFKHHKLQPTKYW